MTRQKYSGTHLLILIGALIVSLGTLSTPVVHVYAADQKTELMAKQKAEIADRQKRIEERKAEIMREAERPFTFYYLDNTKFSQDNLVQNLLQAAFPKEGWMDFYGDESRRKVAYANIFRHKELERDEKGISASFPWIKEYLYRHKGYPRLGVLTRFSKPMTVGFGWPPFNPPKGIRLSQQPDRSKLDEVRKQVNIIKSSLKEATGIDVTFIDPDEETMSHYASVRIIPSDVFYYDNKFKSNPEIPEMSWNPRFLETSYLYSAFRFTPDARAQVEGYLIPEADNSIGMAFCEINPILDGKLFADLINECLVRSLGLPDMVINDRVAETSFIGHWNQINDKISVVSLLDGPHAHHSQYDNVRDILLDKTKSNAEVNAKLAELRRDKGVMPVDPKIQSDHLSAYDKMILGMLYCKKLKIGMSMFEVEKELMTSDDCFNQKKGEGQ